MLYYFRNNMTDFLKWCRHYVRQAEITVKRFEKKENSWYSYIHLEEYYESLKIYRQYIILCCSLPFKCVEYLECCLIDGEEPPKNAASLLTEIFDHWQLICFPKKKSKVKTIDKFNLGHKLRELRITKNLSAKQVSELIGINPKTIYDYEEGIRLVNLNVLYGLSQIYETSIDEIIESTKPSFRKVVF